MAKPILAEDGRLICDPTRPGNPAFRPPSAHPDKIRSVIDLKQGGLGRYCFVETPIQLPPWGHAVSVARPSLFTARPWSIGNADCESAYKCLPFLHTDAGSAACC